MIKKSAVAAVFLLAAAFARGQGGGVPPPVPFLPPEAPESLLSLEIGGSDVDLVAQGYWEVSVLASAAMGLGGNVGVSAPTLLFRQVPDLWLSLTVLDRWFLEASLTAEGFGGEYVAGYRGGEGDFLREVRLGNKGVSFPDLPYIALGVGTSTSFGVSALGSGVGGSAHFLLRYDQARRVTQIWVGGREVTRLEYRPSEYARGRWFLLPDQIIVDLELYVETSGGILTGSDGRTYRRMRSDEYSLSAATGRLDLKTAVGKDRRLLAYYSSMTIPTAGTESAPPFYGRAPATVENVAAGPALILYEEGVHEGFLIANRYALPSSVRPESASAYVRTSATGLPDIGFDAVVLPDGFVRVTRAGADSSRPSRDEYRMPFLGTDLDMAWLYDPEATQAAEGPPLRPEPAYSRILVVETYGTTGSLVLEEAGVLAGSVEVLRNGVPEYGFTYDPVSNIVTLERAPGVSDTIEISYLLATADRGAGSLAAGLGGIFDLSPNWRAWAALGLRWGVPGTGYSAGGDVLPGSLVLTAGFRGGSMEPAAPDGPGPAHRLLAEAALAGSYRRPDAAGWHRIAGMEENAAWTSPFRPTGAWPPNAAISAVDEAFLETLFPDLMRRFHAAASRQRALKFEFTGPVIPAADMAAVRFIEPAAVGDYRAFAFFARSTASEASIAIKLEGAVEALYVEVPAADLSESWRRFVVRYDGLPRLYSQDGEGRPETPVPGAVVRADPSASAGKITITVTATGDGSVFVDELHFLDSAGEFSLSGRGSLSWSRPGPAAQSGALSIVSDPGFSARLSGTASEHPGFAGNVAGSAGFGPLRVSANLRQGWSDGRFEGGAFGHSLELPLDWFAASDSFEHEPASGRFGRRNAISLKGRGLGLSLEQSAAYGAGRLVQNWDLRLTAGSFLSLAGKASNSADGALDLPDEYGKAWIEAFRYALPTLEDFSSRRTSDLAVAFAAGGGRLALTAGSSLREAASLNPAGTSTAEARLGWSFPLGRGIIEPYYRRVWSRSSISGSGGFFGDWEAWASDLSRSDFLLSAVPFAELFDGSTSDLFLMSAAGTSSARYAPEAGVALSRRFGSRWTDLILPSRAVFSLKRELTSSLDTAAEALVAELSASMAAVNLFGSQGVYRATSIYAVDEFAQHVTASASWHDGGQDPLLALAHTAFASFHTGREDTLVAENRVDIKESRDGLAWSERLSLSLTVRPDRTWLGDLVSRLKDRRDTAGRGPAGGNIVSGFWESLRAARGRLSETWNLTAEVRRPYAHLDRYEVGFTQSYETKYVAPQQATLWARLSAYQVLDLLAGSDFWTLGIELTLGARVIF